MLILELILQRHGMIPLLVQADTTCVFAGQLLGVTLNGGRFGTLANGSRLLVELTATNFGQDTGFFARTLEATQSNVKRLIFTDFDYWHVPFTSVINC
ncbi:hypothetical protein VL01_14575 [Aeromonas enteropelogenes]|nr:hypothetical protein VL01_14575 [Aeromonas enteropelogenes]